METSFAFDYAIERIDMKKFLNTLLKLPTLKSGFAP